MGIGVSLILIAAGAILTWAVNATVSGLDINTIGVILMIVGAIGLRAVADVLVDAGAASAARAPRARRTSRTARRPATRAALERIVEGRPARPPFVSTAYA